MTEITLREATHEDIPAMVRLLAQLFAIEADFAIDPAVQARGLAMLLGREGSVVLVAEREGRVIGMTTAQLTVSTACGGLSAGIEDVVVDSADRGKGVGRRLIAAAEAWAQAQGAVRIALLADETNGPALDFYGPDLLIRPRFAARRRNERARARLLWPARLCAHTARVARAAACLTSRGSEKPHTRSSRTAAPRVCRRAPGTSAQAVAPRRLALRRRCAPRHRHRSCRRSCPRRRG